MYYLDDTSKWRDFEQFCYRFLSVEYLDSRIAFSDGIRKAEEVSSGFMMIDSC